MEESIGSKIFSSVSLRASRRNLYILKLFKQWNASQLSVSELSPLHSFSSLFTDDPLLQTSPLIDAFVHNLFTICRKMPRCNFDFTSGCPVSGKQPVKTWLQSVWTIAFSHIMLVTCSPRSVLLWEKMRESKYSKRRLFSTVITKFTWG